MSRPRLKGLPGRSQLDRQPIFHVLIWYLHSRFGSNSVLSYMMKFVEIVTVHRSGENVENTPLMMRQKAKSCQDQFIFP